MAERAHAAAKDSVDSRRNSAAGAMAHSAPPIVHDVLNSPGQVLDQTARGFMEARFGRDFSTVRVHSDARAARSADAVGADAYTVGSNVVFGGGHYAPHTPKGRWLLAHELSHVVQQAGTSSRSGQKLRVEPSTSRWEQDADRMTARALHGNPVSLAQGLPAGAAASLQRAEHGTYVSKLSATGEPAYLEAGEQFYRTWGHPNVKRVSTMLDVLEDLDKAKSPIDTFRVVSHGSSSGLELGLLPEIGAEWFGQDEAGLTTPEKFREQFTGMHLVDEGFFAQIYGALTKDSTTSGLVTLLGGGQAAPAAESSLGILLRAMVEERFLADVQSDTGGGAKIANRAKLEAFNSLRITTYTPVVVDTVAKDKQSDAKKAVAGIRARLPTVMAAASLTFGALSEPEAKDLANPFISGKPAKLKSELTKSIKEGADGPYLKRLRSVRSKITDKTHVEIRGCNVGSDPDTLDAIRSYFGQPGAIPSISAPDLFQYFFEMGVDSYGKAASEETRLTGAFAAAGTAFEDLARTKAGEMTRVTNETTLDELATKYGFNAQKVLKLNPEIKDPDDLSEGDVIWLVSRTEVPAGRYTKLEDFCQDYLGDKFHWPKVWAVNQWLTDPNALTPTDKLQVPANVLTPPIASAAPTAADFAAAVRGGKAVAAVTAENRPVLHVDDASRAKAVGDWLAAQKFDPKGRTAAELSKRYAGGGKKFEKARSGTYVEFLSRSYPNIEDPIFPEDPRYDKHIIRRP